MGNILSYLKWRGDLTLAERDFNEIDNLVLAALSYLDLKGIVPEIGKEEFITVTDAAELFFSNTKEIDAAKSKRLSVGEPALLKEMAASKRFCRAKLSQYIDIVDEINQSQFAALQIELDDGTIYVSYRGTDNSVIGWREDFTLSFQTVPAQESALMYLQSVVIGDQKRYRVGGHSKGGNLAMYASMMCEDSIQKQIIEVYNNDGPGFCQDMPWALQYQKIKGKTIRIIPAFSVIGKLFEEDKPDKIVDSSAKGLLQHDIMTWKIVGSELVERNELTKRCLLLNQIFGTWIENVDMEHRKIFTKDFFDALSAGGANVMTDIANGGVDGFESILYRIIKSDTRTKTVIGKFIDSAIINGRKIDFKTLLKKKTMMRGAVLLFFGILFMQTPDVSLTVLGTILCASLTAYAAIKLVLAIKKSKRKEAASKTMMVVHASLLILMTVIFLNNNLIAISADLILGCAFVGTAYFNMRRFIDAFHKKLKRAWLLLPNAFIFLLFGIVALVTSDSVDTSFIFYVGNYLAIAGIGNLLSAVYDNIQDKRLSDLD